VPKTCATFCSVVVAPVKLQVVAAVGAKSKGKFPKRIVGEKSIALKMPGAGILNRNALTPD
jgi:hypothetical protein